MAGRRKNASHVLQLRIGASNPGRKCVAGLEASPAGGKDLGVSEQQAGAWIVKGAGGHIYVSAWPTVDPMTANITNKPGQAAVFATRAAALDWMKANLAVDGWIAVPLADEMLACEARRAP